jgi:hypothetical protein
MATISNAIPDNTFVLSTDVIRITQELFPGDISTYILDDPDYPQCQFIVIEAQASGPVEEVGARRAQWHAHVAALADGPPILRLTLDYHE